MRPPIKILIAEHDPVDIELMHNELLKNGIDYVSQIVRNEEDYINAIKSFVPDVILADYTFPTFDGPTAFNIREEIAPDTPFIFVSGTIGEERSIELIKDGVTDYVLKEYLFTITHKIIRALNDSKINQQKVKTEHALIQSERRFARAQQVAMMGNWEFDFLTNHLSWSDEMFSIFGLEPEQSNPTLKYVLSVVHPEDLDFVMQIVRNFRISMQDFSLTFRIVPPNAPFKYIFLDSKMENDPEGKARNLHGIVQDVTKMVQLEEKLALERLVREKEITQAVLTAQEAERLKIGNELNENLNQILATAKMYLQLSGKTTEKRQLYLDMSCSFLEQVMVAIRKISKTLVVPSVHIVSLVDNIKNMIHDLSLIHPLSIDFQKNTRHLHLLTEKLQLNIFRIVQEQMNNILVHSNATRAKISISKSLGKVILVITDNGVGCDTLKEKKGVGIINIRSRAKLFDGKVDIISAVGKGYQLRVGLQQEVQN